MYPRSLSTYFLFLKFELDNPKLDLFRLAAGQRSFSLDTIYTHRMPGLQRCRQVSLKQPAYRSLFSHASSICVVPRFHRPTCVLSALHRFYGKFSRLCRTFRENGDDLPGQIQFVYWVCESCGAAIHSMTQVLPESCTHRLAA